MVVAAFEGIVEAGKIRLLSDKALPERARVYVLIPEYSEDEAQATYPVTISANPRVVSPHLANREDASHFRLKLDKEANASI